MNIKLKRQILNKLREVSRWMPAKAQAIKRAESEDRNKYKCNHCKRWCRRKTVQVDHIVPVLDPVVGFPQSCTFQDKENCSGTNNACGEDWTTYVNRLFCSVDNLQVLCKKCHKKKTDAENMIRRESKQKGTYKV